MRRKAFLVDVDRCVGCRACEIACEDENDLPAGAQRVRVATVKTGERSRLYVPTFNLVGGASGCTLCPQLQAEGRGPACVANCLTNAIHFSDLEDIDEAAAMEKGRLIREGRVATVIYVSGSDLRALGKTLR